MGILQATQALTWLLGIGEPLVGRLLMADARTLRFRELAVERDPDCPVCGASASRDRSAVALPLETCASEISVQTLRDRFATGAPVVLDVRTPEEVAHGHLEGLHIPLGDLDRRLDELTPYRKTDLIVVCRSGARSAAAVALLRSAGFGGALNLRGGLQAWAREIDPAFVCV
jgi:adenylyltransferase/sulfurtransferase